jgi:hypothetical protein
MKQYGSKPCKFYFHFLKAIGVQVIAGQFWATSDGIFGVNIVENFNVLPGCNFSIEMKVIFYCWCASG